MSLNRNNIRSFQKLTVIIQLLPGPLSACYKRIPVNGCGGSLLFSKFQFLRSNSWACFWFQSPRVGSSPKDEIRRLKIYLQNTMQMGSKTTNTFFLSTLKSAKLLSARNASLSFPGPSLLDHQATGNVWPFLSWSLYSRCGLVAR